MNREKLPPYYPVFLKIGGKRCVVIGGGQIALRKVMVLIEHRASVDVISPELCPELIELSENGQVRVFRRHYQPGDLQPAFLAIAATGDSDINRQVAAEARRPSKSRRAEAARAVPGSNRSASLRWTWMPTA